jgi:hypothetical protein
MLPAVGFAVGELSSKKKVVVVVARKKSHFHTLAATVGHLL